jgi:hypothetical protein
MLKATILASALALGLAIPARAASDIQKSNTATRPVQTALPDEVVTVVETPRRNTGSVILADAVGGTLLGAAAGGGVALYNHFTNSDGSYGNWQRDIAIGAGIGLAVGLVFGLVDASNTADRTYTTTAIADRRASGFAPPTAAYGARF